MTYAALVPQFWDREELYEDVWSKPLTALVSKYGVSAVAIGKTCRKLQIPLPGRGYWAKKAHGHAVEHKPLPKLHEVPRIFRYQRPTPAIADTVPPPKPEFPVEEEDRIEIEHIIQLHSSGAFVVKHPHKALRHPMVVQARDILRHAFVSKQILLIPWNQSCLDIEVSKESLGRSLAIMASLIAILEDNGVKIRTMPGDRSYGARRNETSATIFGEKILFGILEKIRRQRVPDPNTTPDASGRQRFMTAHEATGELSIHVFSSSRFFTTRCSDSDQIKIESLVPECVASMMKIAVEHRRETAKRQLEEFFRKLGWEELGRLKAQIEAEEARVERLERGADCWQRARRIRGYVLAVAERRKEQGKKLTPDSALGRWVTWALQQADRIDPLAESPTSVLDRKPELEGWSPYGWR